MLTVQLEGHSPRTPAQSSPKKPTSHKQLKLTLAPARPAAHSPWPEQPSTGHGRRSEQSAPSQPGSHTHSSTDVEASAAVRDAAGMEKTDRRRQDRRNAHHKLRPEIRSLLENSGDHNPATIQRGGVYIDEDV